jgi:hypothetical protein
MAQWVAPASRAEAPKDVGPAKVITEKLVKFLEGAPLYVKLRTRLPAVFESVRPEVLELHCSVCGQLSSFAARRKSRTTRPALMTSIPDGPFLASEKCRSGVPVATAFSIGTG